LEDNLAEEVLARCPNPQHVNGSVKSGKERAVKPSAPLGDEFRDCRGNICSGLGGFDIFESEGMR